MGDQTFLPQYSHYESNYYNMTETKTITNPGLRITIFSGLRVIAYLCFGLVGFAKDGNEDMYTIGTISLFALVSMVDFVFGAYCFEHFPVIDFSFKIKIKLVLYYLINYLTGLYGLCFAVVRSDELGNFSFAAYYLYFGLVLLDVHISVDKILYGQSTTIFEYIKKYTTFYLLLSALFFAIMGSLAFYQDFPNYTVFGYAITLGLLLLDLIVHAFLSFYKTEHYMIKYVYLLSYTKYVLIGLIPYGDEGCTQWVNGVYLLFNLYVMFNLLARYGAFTNACRKCIHIGTLN